MNTQEIADGLCEVSEEMRWRYYYAVQGVSKGAWRTLFAPYLSVEPARAMHARLVRDNPACRYQVIKVETVA